MDACFDKLDVLNKKMITDKFILSHFRGFIITKRKVEKNMRDFLDGKLIGMQLRARRFLSQMMEEERGDTNFVAIIIIIVILIAIAGVFKEQLEGAIEKVFGSLTDFIDNGF